MRRHDLVCATREKSSPLLGRHRAFFAALVIQAERTDFSWAEPDDETKLLENVDREANGTLVHTAYRPGDKKDAPDFPTLTPIADAVSLKVQGQYVSYPYPRWERVPARESQTLAQILIRRFPSEAWRASSYGRPGGRT